jgi:O-antigen/teichoic acid export membrane protein
MALTKAFQWSGLTGIFGVALRFVSNLWLTRLLVPDAFALMFAAATVVGLLSVLTDLGFNRFAIRHPCYSDSNVHDTIWSFQFLRGIFVCLLSLMVAIPVYLFQTWIPSDTIWHNPNMPAVLTFLGVGAVLQGATSSEVIVRVKALDQRSLFLIEFSSQVFSVLVAVSFAIWFQSVWALVAAALSSTIVALVGSFTLKQSLPIRFRFDRSVLFEGFKFGRWFWPASVIGVTALQVDRVILGAILPPNTLGFFAIASGLVLAIEGFALKLITSVVFPEFARIRLLGSSQLISKFRQMLLPMEVLVLGLIGFLLGAGPLIVKLIYPPSYEQVGFMLQLLCLRLLVIRQSFSIQLYVSMHKEKYDFFLSCARLGFVILSLALGYYFGGVNGVLYASAVQSIASYVLVQALDRKMNAFRFANFALGVVALFTTYVLFATLASYIGRNL